MSNPPDPTNLSQKFAALQELMTTQHNALMTEIAALRGTGGPETTLRSINQSIWALAGPTPGVTLTQLKAAIEALMGTGPENTLKSINQSIWNLAGSAPGRSLTDLYNLWNPGEGISPYNLLDGLYTNLITNGQTETAAKEILVRLIAQFDTATVTPTMKDLLMTISSQQAQLVSNTASPFNGPVGCCETPFRSITVKYLETNALYIDAKTHAIFPDTAPTGFDIEIVQTSGFGLSQLKADWSQYRVYVASNAVQFGMRFAVERYPTNQWITFYEDNRIPLIPGWDFFVEGDNRLDVYICPISAPLGGVTAPSCMTGTYRQIDGMTDLGCLLYGGTSYRVFSPTISASVATCLGAGFTYTDNGAGRYLYRSTSSQTTFIGWNFETTPQPSAIVVRPAILSSNTGTWYPFPVNLDHSGWVYTASPTGAGCASQQTELGGGGTTAPIQAGDEVVEIFFLFDDVNLTSAPPNIFIGG
jgi:hypothetical protein